jgi:Niemann-Pick C1 protein
VDCFPCVKLKSRIELPENPLVVHRSRLAVFIRRYYAPFILKPTVKYAVLVLFGGIFFGSVISIQHIQLGLGKLVPFCSSASVDSNFYRPASGAAI